MKRALFQSLNRSQRDAVFTASGPLLVLAGAGSGKTRVVTARIARLIQQGVEPQRILAVTFTNKAANEMQQRVGELIGRRRKAKPHISTFHSLCLRILRRHIHQLGYPNRFTIYASGQQESLASSVLREVQMDGAKLKPSELLYFVGRWKCHSIDPRGATATAATDKEHLAAVAYRRYQQQLEAAGAVDFDDLLLCTERLFRGFPAVRRAEAQQFDHIMIDEYQDTNASQYRIIKTLSAGHRNICVVGDDDQSIYGWRGAEVEHILSFTRDWPDAKVVRLEDNYRSTAEILNVANRLIRHNRARHHKVLRADRAGGERPRILQFRDDTAEAEQTIGDIRRRLRCDNAEPRDFAILFRTKEQPRAFEAELRRHNLPYILIGGMSFFDRREVRDVTAFLQLLDNPRDEIALRRVINIPPRGIGPSTIQRLAARAAQRNTSLWDVVSSPAEVGDVEPKLAGAINTFVQRIEDYRNDLHAGSFVETAHKLLNGFRYEYELKRRHPDTQDYESRWRAVEEVINALGEYEQRTKTPDLNDFLNEMMIMQKDNSEDKDNQLRNNAIVLMTLHAAKGLEFPHVYMVGMEESLLPHHRSISTGAAAIEEERRLCYVGITRAQEYLTLSLALSRRKWGRLRPTQPSRFLFEITSGVRGQGAGIRDQGAGIRGRGSGSAAQGSRGRWDSGPRSEVG